MGRIKRVKIINKKRLLVRTSILGEHTREASAVFFIESGAEGAGKFEFGVEVKLVWLRRMCVLDLRAEALC